MEKLLYIFFITTLIACDGNYRDVVIRGRVKDSLTGQFISGAEIDVTCWVYDTEIWESRKVIKDTVSGANGNFSLPFEKGEAIDVEVRHEKYLPFKYSKTLDRNINELEFNLKKME